MKDVPPGLRIDQVALVVKDLWKSMEMYHKTFGWGPWSTWEYKEPLMHDVELRGKPAKVSCLGAEVHANPIDFELIFSADRRWPVQGISGPEGRRVPPSLRRALGAYPSYLAYDSAKGEIFVTAEGASKTVGNYSIDAGVVYVISDTNNSIVATIPVGDYPGGIAYDSAKGELFVANFAATPDDSDASDYVNGSLSVISDASDKVVATVPVGASPTGVAYDPAKGEIFVADSGSNSTSIISDKTNSVVATVPVGDFPNSIAYDFVKGEIFVANYGKTSFNSSAPGGVYAGNGGSVSVISDTSDKVVATLAGGVDPFQIAYDPSRGELFISNPTNDTVTVISDAATSSSATTTTASTTSTTSSTAASSKSSSSSLSLSYLAMVAVNVAIFGILGGRAAKARTKRMP